MNSRSIWRPTKDEVISDQGAVATARSLTSNIGLDILKQGGNAVDAAVAVGFSLAVIEPMSSCIAGHGQMLIHMAQHGGQNIALDFSHRAPKAATPDMYNVLQQSEAGILLYDVEDNANSIGYRSIGVPGVTAGLCKAHELFGTLPLELLLEPAIHFAEDGFEVDWITALRISDSMSEFVKFGEAAKVFCPTGYPPIVGVDKVVQRDLADTLRRISRQGKDGFYKGDIPHAVAEYMKRNDGLLTVDDFTDYPVQVLEPARVTYREHDILSIPIPSGGTTALETFNILENFDLGNFEHNSSEHLHILIESARHAFADRYHYLGDSDVVPVPMKGLLSTEYAQDIAALIDLETAFFETERKRQPWELYEQKALHDAWVYDTRSNTNKHFTPSPPSSEDCTTHFGIIDNDRNMVSCTQTAVNTFGSKVIAPGTGILFTNGMAVFNPRSGAANSIAGYKRGLGNMAPLIGLREGKAFISVGAPGGRKIMNCNTQVMTNIIDFGMGIQEAITAPRVDAADRDTQVDIRIDASVVTALRDMGHNIVMVEETAYQSGFATPVGLMVHPQSQQIHAGVDAFRLAEAQGL